MAKLWLTTAAVFVFALAQGCGGDDEGDKGPPSDQATDTDTSSGGGADTAFPVMDFAPRHVRTIATVEFPGGAITPDGADFDCSSQWSSGCLADIP